MHKQRFYLVLLLALAVSAEKVFAPPKPDVVDVIDDTKFCHGCASASCIFSDNESSEKFCLNIDLKGNKFRFQRFSSANLGSAYAAGLTCSNDACLAHLPPCEDAAANPNATVTFLPRTAEDYVAEETASACSYPGKVPGRVQAHLGRRGVAFPTLPPPVGADSGGAPSRVVGCYGESSASSGLPSISASLAAEKFCHNFAVVGLCGRSDSAFGCVLGQHVLSDNLPTALAAGLTCSRRNCRVLEHAAPVAGLGRLDFDTRLDGEGFGDSFWAGPYADRGGGAGGGSAYDVVAVGRFCHEFALGNCESGLPMFESCVVGQHVPGEDLGQALASGLLCSMEDCCTQGHTAR
jgi:hypothetical protein